MCLHVHSPYQCCHKTIVFDFNQGFKGFHIPYQYPTNIPWGASAGFIEAFSVRTAPAGYSASANPSIRKKQCRSISGRKSSDRYMILNLAKGWFPMPRSQEPRDRPAAKVYHIGLPNSTPSENFLILGNDLTNQEHGISQSDKKFLASRASCTMAPPGFRVSLHRMHCPLRFLAFFVSRLHPE